MPTLKRCSCTTLSGRYATEPPMYALKQTFFIASKEWRLLSRNPHGLAVLFLMPAIFLLVMSFALKNTLTSDDIALPRTGWLVEDPSPLAMQWSNDWRESRPLVRATCWRRALSPHMVRVAEIKILPFT